MTRPPDRKPPAPPPSDEDQPEIETTFAMVGRETMAAIAAELVGDEGAQGTVGARSLPREPTIRQPADTLKGLPHGLRGPSLQEEEAPTVPGPRAPGRGRLVTRGYSDPPPPPMPAHATVGTPGEHLAPWASSNAPTSPLPETAPVTAGKAPRSQAAAAAPLDEAPSMLAHQPMRVKASAPATTTRPTATHDRSPASQQALDPSIGVQELHELVTFVVRADPAELASDEARRRFVRRYLAHRLPVRSLEEVSRVDVTPWTERGTVVVRVWCRIPIQPTPANPSETTERP